MRTGIYSSRKSKQLGSSFIELDGCVHESVAVNESHFETEAIYNTVLGINELLVAESFLM